MIIKRREAKRIKVGNVHIGGASPVVIQSMVKAKASDIKSSLWQIKELEQAGCQIARFAIKDSSDAKALRVIKQKTEMPLVADIHFDWRLALEAIDNGVDKIRLNPGNIYQPKQVREIAAAARSAKIPIRVGVNSGSLKTGHLSGASRINRMVKSALDYTRMLESFSFRDIVISLKASNVFDTTEAYRKISKICDYPLHLGVTATGSPFEGVIKSSIAIGALLLEGIGDTIRVSLTDQPREEVRAARAILKALGRGNFGPEIISCPTCGRCEVNLIKIVKELEERLSPPAGRAGTIDYSPSTRPTRVAVMGCVVNGPGEAEEADIGVAFGKKDGLLFKKGKPVRKIPVNSCSRILIKEVKKMFSKPV